MQFQTEEVQSQRDASRFLGVLLLNRSTQNNKGKLKFVIKGSFLKRKERCTLSPLDSKVASRKQSLKISNARMESFDRLSDNFKRSWSSFKTHLVQVCCFLHNKVQYTICVKKHVTNSFPQVSTEAWEIKARKASRKQKKQLFQSPREKTAKKTKVMRSGAAKSLTILDCLSFFVFSSFCFCLVIMMRCPANIL